MKLNCEGDYKLQSDWLEQHKNATIVYDTKLDLPIRAEYINPIYQSYVIEPQRFFARVKAMQEAEE